MLLFELFPAFMVLVSIVIGVMLWARRNAPEPERQAPRRETGDRAEPDRYARPRRPSMEP